MGTGIDFIITGHTHLERSIPMDGGRHYFNCGTWIRLLGFSKQLLEDKASFQQAYKTLKDGGMDAIDNSGLLKDQTSIVCISIQSNGKTVGQLAHVKGGTDGEEISLEYVAHSKDGL